MVPVAPGALLRRPRSALTWVTTIVLGLGGLMIAILIFLARRSNWRADRDAPGSGVVPGDDLDLLLARSL
jgi:hypothetical protein